MSIAPPSITSTQDMVFVPGGSFTMGSDHHYREEAPAHPVTVGGFWIDRHPVTNDQFRSFVQATGYRTLAERFQSSVVFQRPDRPVSLDDHMQWWRLMPGAGWRRPRGPGSSIRGLSRHPVVHVAWADVDAYAQWAGKVLPTEAEWEYAARGGLQGMEFAWGEEFTPDGRHMANTWQGAFPTTNTLADGYRWTSPVNAFLPNGFGLHDMIGNVWEWTASPYTADHRGPTCCGPAPSASSVARQMMKGGSYLCAPNYCRRYRPAARMPQDVDTGTSHLGFRCVVRPGTV